MTEPSLVQRCVYRMLAFIARLICLTLRVKHVNAEPVDALRDEHRNCVIAFWHGSMVPGWFLHRPRTIGRQASALVSMSKDGAILASVLEHWGFHLIRGSSHVGGKEALQMMTQDVMRGHTLLVTPDGPRGPRHVMKAGAALAARRTGVPLVIAGIAIRSKKVFPGSWDRFEMPLPFSRVCVWYDEPIMVPTPVVDASEGAAETDRRAFDAYVAELGRRLNDVHRNAHQALGIGVQE